MLTLAALLVLAGGPVPPTIGEIFYGHAMGHSDPIADITPLPARVPDCKTDEEIRKALAEKDHGQLQSCFVPRSARLQKQQPR